MIKQTEFPFTRELDKDYEARLGKETTAEFLANRVYLPGYMALRQEDYDAKGGTFSFEVREPPVARGNIVDYLTPRGLHICVSQAGYALVENLIREGKAGDMDIEALRRILLSGRVKIGHLNEDFRRGVKLGNLVQARFDIKKFRLRTNSTLELDFDFQNRAVTGYMFSTIESRPVEQMNEDIRR